MNKGVNILLFWTGNLSIVNMSSFSKVWTWCSPSQNPRHFLKFDTYNLGKSFFKSTPITKVTATQASCCITTWIGSGGKFGRKDQSQGFRLCGPFVPEVMLLRGNSKMGHREDPDPRTGCPRQGSSHRWH